MARAVLEASEAEHTNCSAIVPISSAVGGTASRWRMPAVGSARLQACMPLRGWHAKAHGHPSWQRLHAGPSVQWRHCPQCTVANLKRRCCEKLGVKEGDYEIFDFYGMEKATKVCGDGRPGACHGQLSQGFAGGPTSQAVSSPGLGGERRVHTCRGGQAAELD